MDDNASIQEEACADSSDYHDEVNEPGPRGGGTSIETLYGDVPPKWVGF